jgi:hypothetical protein
MALINGEYVKFLDIDLVGNSISRLVRGQGKSITNTIIPKYTIVQSILPQDLMNSGYWNQDWYYFTNTPLQINPSAEAQFFRGRNY